MGTNPKRTGTLAFCCSDRHLTEIIGRVNAILCTKYPTELYAETKHEIQAKDHFSPAVTLVICIFTKQ